MAEPVTVTVLPPATRLSLRAGGNAALLLGEAFGLSFPQEACRATNGTRSALWLGPDEWLLLAPDGEMPALGAWMTDALGVQPASIVDISDRNVAVEVSGPKAAEVLNAFNRSTSTRRRFRGHVRGRSSPGGDRALADSP